VELKALGIKRGTDAVKDDTLGDSQMVARFTKILC
jgi:hypothetical protein